MPQKQHSDNFSPHLFWDVSKENFSLEKHSKFIVKRVLEYGLLNDWLFLKNFYGIEKIAEIAKGLRDLEPKALSYIATISNTPKEEFRCYNYQRLNKAHLHF